MSQHDPGARFLRFCRAAALAACCPLLAVQAQETPDPQSDDAETIDEIVVIVDPRGKPVDIDLRRLEEIRQKVIRDFALEQTKQEQEYWRLKLRSALQGESSRFAWGYDAQQDAADDQPPLGSTLPIDRVRPATVFSIRF